MSSQIAMYKLDTIRRSLVSARFGEKKAESLKTIGKLIYDAVVDTIPERIMDMFTAEEDAYINFNPKTQSFRGEPKYFRVTSHVSWYSSHDILRLVLSMMNADGISSEVTTPGSLYVDLPSPLPVGENYINNVVFFEIKKKGKLYEAIKEHMLRDKEIKTLDNKIRCLFASKRFYPGTLKNDFPEAYEVYVKMFEEKILKPESKPEPTTCDSIESIRATLLSNK